MHKWVLLLLCYVAHSSVIQCIFQLTKFICSTNFWFFFHIWISLDSTPNASLATPQFNLSASKSFVHFFSQLLDCFFFRENTLNSVWYQFSTHCDLTICVGASTCFLKERKWRNGTVSQRTIIADTQIKRTSQIGGHTGYLIAISTLFRFWC